MFRNSGMYYRGRHPVTGIPFEVPVMHGAGISYDWSDLSLHNGIRQTPTDPFVTGVNFRHTANSTLQFLSPQGFVRTPGTHRNIGIHNHTDDYELDLRKWGTTIDKIMTLYPGDYAQFQLSFRQDGSGELIGLIVPERSMEHSADSDGTLSGLPNWTDGSDNLRPVRFGTSQNAFVHADAFDIHGGSRPSVSSHGEIADYTGSWEWVGAWTVNMKGLMFVDFQYELAIDAASANLTGDNGPRLYRVRGTGAPQQIGESPRGGISGDGAHQAYAFNHVFRVEEGGLFFFMHAYTSVSGLANIYFDNWLRKVELFPEIQRAQ